MRSVALVPLLFATLMAQAEVYDIARRTPPGVRRRQGVEDAPRWLASSRARVEAQANAKSDPQLPVELAEHTRRAARLAKWAEPIFL
jgi:hypothetical protein